MTSLQIISLIFFYFSLLLIISYFTREESNESFFNANKSSPWYLVAFGMIGASLSGVTFISVPGWVENSQFSYFQMVLGYTVGYFFIGKILLPLYYKMKLTSIYTYLDNRFGANSYMTGASFFLISRVIGASFRLFLVANVMQLLVFDQLNIPFWITVTFTIILIWIYTFKSGIKTIVWTDTLQTLFMLIAVFLSIFKIIELLNIDFSSVIFELSNDQKTKIFFFENVKESKFFWKQFISGAFIAIVMTGLDQDMMQKNLTCKSLKDAQKNMFWFTLVLVLVNFLFLALGYLLTEYASLNNINANKDNLFPTIANLSEMGVIVSATFILGLIAAAYSSADSALTSMTTSFCIDILKIEKKFKKTKQIYVRKITHVSISILLIIIILFFKYIIANESVVEKLFLFAGYTYGPLLGLYSFGLFTNYKINDKLVPYVCILAPFLSYFLSWILIKNYQFDFGFFILIVNGAITFIGLRMIKDDV